MTTEATRPMADLLFAWQRCVAELSGASDPSKREALQAEIARLREEYHRAANLTRTVPRGSRR